MPAIHGSDGDRPWRPLRPGPLQILVVEDDAVTALLLEAILDQLGHEVVDSVADAAAAFAAADIHRPDLMTMDVCLAGGGDGIAAAIEIRRMLAVPALFVTAQTDPATARRLALAQPVGHIVKPFSAGEVAAALATARMGGGGA